MLTRSLYLQIFQHHQTVFSLLIIIGDVHNSLAFRQLSQKFGLFPHLEYVKCCLDLYSFEHYLVFGCTISFSLLLVSFWYLAACFFFEFFSLMRYTLPKPPAPILLALETSQILYTSVNGLMLKRHHHITLVGLTGDLQNGVIESKPSAIPKSPKLLHIFHLYEYFP